MIDPAAFVRANTGLAHAPLVPELALHLASEITPIWQATEDWLARTGLEPPFWAFAWPGGQALARYVLDHPQVVAGRRVLDFAAGCGIAAIACARAGAARVEAAEIDPLAAAAIALNAEANAAAVTALVAEVWVADPGRAYLPTDGMQPLARYLVPTTRELEDHPERTATLYRLLPPGEA